MRAVNINPQRENQVPLPDQIPLPDQVPLPDQSFESGRDGQHTAEPSHTNSTVRTSKYATYADEELKQRKRQFTMIEIALIVVALILAWASFGLMMRTGFLPVFDLGYSWFDEHVVNFFGITAGHTAA